jgi:ATP-dependent Lon protease
MSENEEQPTSAKDRVFGFEEDLSTITVPEVLPVLPLRGVVVFPSAIVPLLISRGPSLKVVAHALAGDRMLAMVTQKHPEDEEPAADGLYTRGTAGRILKMLKYPDSSVRILVQGLRRIDIVEIVSSEPFFTASIRQLADELEESADVEAMQAHMVNQFGKFVSMIPYLPDELQVVAMNIKDPGKVTDLIASNLNVALEEKQELLATLDVRKRVERLTTILNREIELLELGQKIQSQVQDELSKTQKDFYLRQQMRAIQKELGEGDPRDQEIEELRRRLEESSPPEAVLKVAEQELERLRMIPIESAEHTVVRTYLEWIVSLPWAIATKDDLDIPHARQVLDEDHFDLEKIKDRILEFLAVRKLKNDSKGPILLRHPPGTANVLVVRSPAPWGETIRMSLGGMRDEPRSRHRRTSLPARPPDPEPAQRRLANRYCPRRDRQAGADFRGDPAFGTAGSPRPRAEQQLRHLPRRSLRPLAGPVHHPRQPARTQPGAAARPHGGHRAGRIHRRGKAAHRASAPAAEAAGGKRHHQGTADVRRRRRAVSHSPLHARGGTAEPRARDRQRLPQSCARRHRGQHRARRRHARKDSGAARAGALLPRGRRAHG